MDQSIKRTLVLAVVVVVVGKLVSGAYDAFFVDSQVEMRENQQAMRNAEMREAQEQSAARKAERRARRCAEIQQSRVCTSARGNGEIRTCLVRLRNEGCHHQPRIQLCAAVEELEECADPFADQRHNGCNSLRTAAQCKQLPAPDDRDGLWQIGLDDGMWDGE